MSRYNYFSERVRTVFLLELLELAAILLRLALGTSWQRMILMIAACAAIDVIVIYFWIVRPLRVTRAILRKSLIQKEADKTVLQKLPGFCREERDYLTFLGDSYRKAELLKLEIHESELLALQTQINPHFLYNTLDAIRSDALVEGNEAVAEIAESLSAYFRYSISSLNHTVALDEELHNIEEYFKIQHYRFGRRLQFEILYADDWDPKEIFYIPKMILQPLVENAIFHGIEPKEAPGTVTVRIDRSEQALYLCVEDDGIGMPDWQREALNQSIRQLLDSSRIGLRRNGHGIAMRNVHQRIQLLYGDAYGLYVTSTEHVGTKILMTLPVRTAEETL